MVFNILIKELLCMVFVIMSEQPDVKITFLYLYIYTWAHEKESTKVMLSIEI